MMKRTCRLFVVYHEALKAYVGTKEATRVVLRSTERPPLEDVLSDLMQASGNKMSESDKSEVVLEAVHEARRLSTVREGFRKYEGVCLKAIQSHPLMLGTPLCLFFACVQGAVQLQHANLAETHFVRYCLELNKKLANSTNPVVTQSPLPGNTEIPSTAAVQTALNQVLALISHDNTADSQNIKPFREDAWKRAWRCVDVAAKIGVRPTVETLVLLLSHAQETKKLSCVADTLSRGEGDSSTRIVYTNCGPTIHVNQGITNGFLKELSTDGSEVYHLQAVSALRVVMEDAFRVMQGAAYEVKHVADMDWKVHSNALRDIHDAAALLEKRRPLFAFSLPCMLHYAQCGILLRNDISNVLNDMLPTNASDAVKAKHASMALTANAFHLLSQAWLSLDPTEKGDEKNANNALRISAEDLATQLLQRSGGEERVVWEDAQAVITYCTFQVVVANASILNDPSQQPMHTSLFNNVRAARGVWKKYLAHCTAVESTVPSEHVEAMLLLYAVAGDMESVENTIDAYQALRPFASTLRFYSYLTARWRAETKLHPVLTSSDRSAAEAPEMEVPPIRVTCLLSDTQATFSAMHLRVGTSLGFVNQETFRRIKKLNTDEEEEIAESTMNTTAGTSSGSETGAAPMGNSMGRERKASTDTTGMSMRGSTIPATPTSGPRGSFVRGGPSPDTTTTIPKYAGTPKKEVRTTPSHPQATTPPQAKGKAPTGMYMGVVRVHPDGTPLGSKRNKPTMESGRRY